jgi:hypothetical protein
MLLIKTLLQYWSQLTLLLGVIGYFVSKITEQRFKRKEVRFTLFEKQKADSITAFIKDYIICENFFSSINHHEIMSKSITAKDLDRLEEPIKVNLQSSFNNLNLYLTEKEIYSFKEIFESYFLMRKSLMEFYSDTGPKMEIKHNWPQSNIYTKNLNSEKRLNASRLTQIGVDFRKAYN